MAGSRSPGDSDELGLAHEIWPTHTQELLLHACFSSGERALAAYSEWDSLEGLDGIRPQSYPLLALLYRNLSGSLKPERAGILEGAYRKTWYENQVLLRRHAKLLDALLSAGIETVHLEGLPLAVRYYADLGVRPLRFLRLLIRGADRKGVMALLGELNYKMTSWQPSSEAPDFLRFQGGAEFHAPEGGGRLVLHWRAIQVGGDACDEYFWSGSERFDVQAIPGRTLCASDELYLVCVRELSWAYRPRLIWVADALAILRSGRTVDWARLRHLARETGYVVPVRAALRYLAVTFEAPVPAAVMQEFATESANLSDRLLHGRLASRKIDPLLTDIGALLAQNYRTLGLESVLRSMIKLPRFLQYQWMLPRQSQLPGYAWRRLLQRVNDHASN